MHTMQPPIKFGGVVRLQSKNTTRLTFDANIGPNSLAGKGTYAMNTQLSKQYNHLQYARLRKENAENALSKASSYVLRLESDIKDDLATKNTPVVVKCRFGPNEGSFVALSATSWDTIEEQVVELASEDIQTDSEDIQTNVHPWTRIFRPL